MHRCDECGHEHVVCKNCGELGYDDMLWNLDGTSGFCSEKCQRDFHEKRVKKIRARLRRLGRWARICPMCEKGLVKGRCSFQYFNMDGKPAQDSLTCDDCIEKEDAYWEREMYA